MPKTKHQTNFELQAPTFERPHMPLPRDSVRGLLAIMIGRWGISISLLCFCSLCAAADWPQFLGPNRNGVAAETNLPLTWPKDGPKTLWKIKVGEGWSGPVVSSNRVIIFHRLDDQEIVEALNVTNGARLWRAAYATDYRDDFGFDAGPRSTPAIDGQRVFTFGANGILNGWDSANGTNLWRINTRQQFKNEKGFFGIACSPLVEGNAVILNVGSSENAGIVAFDKATGKVLWKAGHQEASYSSPVAANLKDRRCLFVLTRQSLMALEAGGKVLWEFPWKPRIEASVTAATPLVIGDQIFISASYGAGAALLHFGESKPEVIWSGDDLLSNHYATSVYHNGFLYGFDGRQEQRCNLRCVELKTGKIRWSQHRFGAGTLMIVGDKLLVLTERGELIAASATPEKFLPLGRAQIIGADSSAHPALANGLFFARDKSVLACFDLNATK
jgi:outer membrane protein assembly factor BamB